MDKSTDKHTRREYNIIYRIRFLRYKLENYSQLQKTKTYMIQVLREKCTTCYRNDYDVINIHYTKLLSIQMRNVQHEKIVKREIFD